MALSAYNDLKTKAASWLRRSGNATYVAEVPDLITLGEAKLNAELGPVETDQTLPGVVGSRSLDISELSIVQPIALFLTPSSGQDEIPLEQQSASGFGFLTASAEPRQWVYDSESAIKLNSPCAAAYSFRFRYRGRFALSASSTTNWLLRNRPDVYLAATLGWGSAYLENFAGAATWQAFLDREIPLVRHTLAQGRRGTLKVDAGLLSGARGGYNGQLDQ